MGRRVVGVLLSSLGPSLCDESSSSISVLGGSDLPVCDMRPCKCGYACICRIEDGLLVVP